MTLCSSDLAVPESSLSRLWIGGQPDQSFSHRSLGSVIPGSWTRGGVGNGNCSRVIERKETKDVGTGPPT